MTPRSLALLMATFTVGAGCNSDTSGVGSPGAGGPSGTAPIGSSSFGGTGAGATVPGSAGTGAGAFGSGAGSVGSGTVGVGTGTGGGSSSGAGAVVPGGVGTGAGGSSMGAGSGGSNTPIIGTTGGVPSNPPGGTYFPGAGGSPEARAVPGATAQCYCDPSAGNPTPHLPSAIAELANETVDGTAVLHARLTLNPKYVDNTYGVNSIGWGKRGHRWTDLLRSDAAAMGFHDSDGQARLVFHLDYINDDASAPSGFRSAGPLGGDGRMVGGNAADVVKWSTSLSLNLNERGYPQYTVDSPATDENYTPNPAAPNWDYRVIYEAWVKMSIFGNKQFGWLNFPYLHVSPGKTGVDKVPLVPCTCPPGITGKGSPSGSTGGGCPHGYMDFLTSEGVRTCVPISGGTGGASGSNTGGTSGGGGGCPYGYMDFLTSEGRHTCVPISGGAGGAGGSTNTGGSTGTGGGCPYGYMDFVTSEGQKTCVPISGTNPTPYCPVGVKECSAGCGAGTMCIGGCCVVWIE